MSVQYTVDQVKKHKSEKSVWMIIHNDVYDVTTFLNEHPGGADSLMDVAGIDGTQAFEDVGHSDDARIMMKKYKIGTLPPGERTKFTETCCPALPKREHENKTWRTFEGSPSRSTAPMKSSYTPPTTPRPDRRVPAIIVPIERDSRRRPRGPPCESSRLKWALIALAGAIVIGFVLKKYAS